MPRFAFSFLMVLLAATLPAQTPATPRETPPDPYADELPDVALQSDEGFLLVLQRRVENTVRAAVDEELARLRRESERAERRLSALMNEAGENLRRAVRGDLPDSSPEAVLTRAFFREFTGRAGRAFSPLQERLDAMEQSVFRRAVMEYANSLTPLTLYRSIEAAGEDDDGGVTLLSNLRHGLDETLREGLLAAMDANGLSLDEASAPLFEEGVLALVDSLETMELK